jgi:pyruvate dehydrogenase E2 component (dihydrolipoamide acetyltransferase)
MSDVAPTPATEPAEGLRGATQLIEPTRAELSILRRSAETRATVPTIELRAQAALDPRLASAPSDQLISLVVSAAAAALRALPRANGAYRDGHYELYSRVNIGVTLIGEGMFATPTIFDADRRSPAEIADELAGFRELLAAGEALRGNESAGATFTILDFTGFRAEPPTPLLNPPQAGALAAGAVREVPVVRDHAVVPGAVIGLALEIDHRIIYGHQAAAFLEAIRTGLEEGPG